MVLIGLVMQVAASAPRTPNGSRLMASADAKGFDTYSKWL